MAKEQMSQAEYDRQQAMQYQGDTPRIRAERYEGKHPFFHGMLRGITMTVGMKVAASQQSNRIEQSKRMKAEMPKLKEDPVEEYDQEPEYE